METKLTCICCPMGCEITVEIENGTVTSVFGNSCPRGAAYAPKEVTNPTRIVTSIVKVTGGEEDMVSVKTATEIPKGKIFDCLLALKGFEVNAPVKIGDVLLHNVADTGADIVATKDVAVSSKW